MAPSSSRCGACRRPLVEISLAQAGTTMTMRSCSGCDTREWHVDGGRSDLDGVLGTVAGGRERRPRVAR